MAKHNEIGKRGEDIASKYVENKGFFILDRNYRKNWGELDIVAEKNGCLHFFEVKTVSRKSFAGKFEQEINSYKPEFNLHFQKINRLKRVIQSYILNKDRSRQKWQFHLLCVFLDLENRVGKIKFIENIII